MKSILLLSAFLAASAMFCGSPGFSQSLNLVSDADGFSTMQNVSINAAGSQFDPDLTMNSTQSCGWQAKVTNTRDGVVFQIRRGSLSGPASVQSSISVSAADGGGEASFVPAGTYASGTPIQNISTTYETLGWIKSNGNSRFKILIDVSSKSKNGNGTVSGTLSIIGALAP